MKTIITCILLLLAPNIASANLGGIYSNRASGFDVESLFVAKDGKAYYFISVAGVPVKWRLDAKTQTITIRGNLGPNFGVAEREFKYDAKTDVVMSENKDSDRKSRLANISKEIPEKIQQILDTFDWDFEKHVVGGKRG
jgi:hypothetical protein